MLTFACVVWKRNATQAQRELWCSSNALWACTCVMVRFHLTRISCACVDSENKAYAIKATNKVAHKPIWFTRPRLSPVPVEWSHRRYYHTPFPLFLDEILNHRRITPSIMSLVPSNCILRVPVVLRLAFTPLLRCTKRMKCEIFVQIKTVG